MPPTMTQPRPSRSLDEIVDRDYDFKLFGIDSESAGDNLGLTIVSKATGGDGKTRLRCIASSSVEDRHGDTMTEACVRDMKKQAAGLTIFLNHQYRWPEDVFGTVESARTALADGVVMLHLTIVADEADERVAASVRKMESGIRAGISIGAMILDYELKDGDEDSWFPALTINKVELLEASVVGIPANPKSWVDQVVKNFRAKGVLTSSRPVQIGEKGVELVKAELGETVELEAPEPPMPVTQGETPEEIVAGYLDQLEGGAGGLKDLEARLTDSVAQSIAWGIDQGHAEAFADTSVEDLVSQILSMYAAPVRKADKSSEPNDPPEEANSEGDEPEDALEAVDEDSDSGAADEGADASTEVEAQLAKLAEAGALGSLSDLTDLLRESLSTVVAEREARAAVEAEKEMLTAQLRGANDTVEAAVRVVKELMALPAGRKSQMGRIVEQSTMLARLQGSVYGDEVLALIKNGERL